MLTPEEIQQVRAVAPRRMFFELLLAHTPSEHVWDAVPLDLHDAFTSWLNEYAATTGPILDPKGMFPPNTDIRGLILAALAARRG